MKIGDLITIKTKGYHKYNGCIGEIVRQINEWYFVKMRDDLVLELHESEMVNHDQ